MSTETTNLDSQYNIIKNCIDNAKCRMCNGSNTFQGKGKIIGMPTNFCFYCEDGTNQNNVEELLDVIYYIYNGLTNNTLTENELILLTEYPFTKRIKRKY